MSMQEIGGAAAAKGSRKIVDLVVRPDGVAVVTIDDPGASVNTITVPFGEELVAAIDRVERTETIRAAVIVSGKKESFVVGANLEMLKSITLEGEDITDEPIDLTGKQAVSGLVIRMTDRLTQIAGHVTDERGQTVRDYVVVILPAEAKQEPLVAGRWIRTARPDSNGRFETRGMRPGRYVATAVEDLEHARQAPRLDLPTCEHGRPPQDRIQWCPQFMRCQSQEVTLDAVCRRRAPGRARR